MTTPKLPTYYYLDHFMELLSFVEGTYTSVLEDSHRAFISDFRSLPQNEQCLLIRMLNRRGHIFDRRKLIYAEIKTVPQALTGLKKRRYVRELDAVDYRSWLCRLTKTALAGLAKAHATEVRASWPKARLVDHALAHIPFAFAHAHMEGGNFVVLADSQPIEFVLYLYFGKTEVDLKKLALRDLGILRINDAASFTARFSEADEARACFHYSRILTSLSAPSPTLYHEALERIYSGPNHASDLAQALRDETAFKVGSHFEKTKDYANAVKLYRFTASSDCNERLVRLLWALGEKREVKALLERMIDDPASDDEYVFASDFHDRKFGGQRISARTRLLREGRRIIIDEAHRGAPEDGVASVLRRSGWRVYRAENSLWHTLFGLLFWDELFEAGQLSSGFDWQPNCLKAKRFATLFEAAIQAKLFAMRRGDILPSLLETIARQQGKPNGLFRWGALDVEALKTLVAQANAGAVASIIELMTLDFEAVRDGFPDLMLVRDGGVRFVEIKAEGDVVRRNQLTRLHQLQTAGLDAEILKVDYRYDPDQTYVVVDVETTGGWGGFDRITEIGAIKIRNHDVVGEWHSLINPQRRIPARIVLLTGINDGMVRDAPVFAEIAGSFLDFMGDAVFVAHNVNFDYGRLSGEFARLEHHFRFPKFCTRAGMRRYFPGYESYSLENLCRTHSIELDTHHRALCDARAAGQLLNLINRQRQAIEILT